MTRVRYPRDASPDAGEVLLCGARSIIFLTPSTVTNQPSTCLQVLVPPNILTLGPFCAERTVHASCVFFFSSGEITLGGRGEAMVSNFL